MSIQQTGNQIEFPESMTDVLQFFITEAKKKHCTIISKLINGCMKKKYIAEYTSPHNAHAAYIRLCAINRWDHREKDRYNGKKRT